MSEVAFDEQQVAKASRIGAGCLTLFALPFVGVGIFATVELVRGLLGDNTSGMPPGFALLFALAFGGSGLAIIGMGRYGARKLRETAALRADRPAEPWRWRADWAEGTARSPQTAGAIGIGVFAFLWNVISAPVLFFIPEEVADGNTVALVGLLFPLVGLGLIVWAARLYIRQRKYRGTHVALPVVPVRPGTALAATLHTRFPGGPPATMLLRLSCIHRTVTGSGDDRSVNERPIWQDERELAGMDIAMDFDGARVPVDFEIPADAPSTTPGDGDNRILWRLDASAETPGVDYAETFELPIFASADVSETVDAATLEETESKLALAGDADATAPADPTIRIEPAGSGIEIFSSPGRNRSPMWPLLLFLVLWWGFIILMTKLGAPIFFPLVFGLFGVLIGWFAIDLLFTSIRTQVTGSGFAVRTEGLGFRRVKEIARDDVKAVAVKVGMSQSKTATQTARAWHDVEIRHTGGKTAIARHIPTRSEAEWVARVVRTAAGL